MYPAECQHGTSDHVTPVPSTSFPAHYWPIQTLSAVSPRSINSRWTNQEK